ncbi:MAG: hypothetical protein LBS74_09575 [Oscillospiraceae bacterium]|jgi:GH18 family chitinase|nr:hypothetical protein [Oscillospiraceae bacterium]
MAKQTKKTAKRLLSLVLVLVLVVSVVSVGMVALAVERGDYMTWVGANGQNLRTGDTCTHNGGSYRWDGADWSWATSTAYVPGVDPGWVLTGGNPGGGSGGGDNPGGGGTGNGSDPGITSSPIKVRLRATPGMTYGNLAGGTVGGAVNTNSQAKNNEGTAYLSPWDMQAIGKVEVLTLNPGQGGAGFVFTGTTTDGNWYKAPRDGFAITTDSHGCVTLTNGEINYNPGISAKSGNLNYKMCADIDGVSIWYEQQTVASQTVYAADFIKLAAGQKQYGAGIPDGIVEGWAKLGTNAALTKSGGQRQLFSVNYVKDVIAAFGDPARSVRNVTATAPTTGDGSAYHQYAQDVLPTIEAFRKELQGYYPQAKFGGYLTDGNDGGATTFSTIGPGKSNEIGARKLVDGQPVYQEGNDQYMWHETDANYLSKYSPYFLHDVTLQGVWDAMPAKYGWQQDSSTEPGIIVKQNWGAVNNRSYALSLGGQNPWVLCDYLERHAGYMENGQVIEGTESGAGWYKGYDEISQAPYLWNPDKQAFLTYENEQSITARCDYINQNNLGGIIIWEMSGDNSATFPLTKLIKQKLGNKNIIGYFTNWGVYNPYHQFLDPNSLPLDTLTHVNYSFFQVGGAFERGIPAPAFGLNSTDRWCDDYKAMGGSGEGEGDKMMAKFGTLKNVSGNNFKLLVSVGGWTRGDGFDAMIKSPTNMDAFVASCKTFLQTYSYFDGIDLDWEYPSNNRAPDFDDNCDLGSPSSLNGLFDNYTLLCQKLRTMLDTMGSRNLLTATIPAAPGNVLNKQDLYKISQSCTFVNAMTYDYHGAFDPIIGHNNPLYASDYPTMKDVPNTGANGIPYATREWSTDNSVQFYVKETPHGDGTNQLGIPANKLNIGTGFYSRGWAGVKGTETVVNGTTYRNPAPLTDPTPIFDVADVVEPTLPQFVVFKIGSAVSYRSAEPNKGFAIVAQAVIFEGRAYSVVADVAAALGLRVGYVAATDSVTIRDDNYIATVNYDTAAVTIRRCSDDSLVETYNLDPDQYFKNIDGRTYAPARALVILAQKFGYSNYRTYWQEDGGYITFSTDRLETPEKQAAAVAEAAPYL